MEQLYKCEVFSMGTVKVPGLKQVYCNPIVLQLSKLVQQF